MLFSVSDKPPAQFPSSLWSLRFSLSVTHTPRGYRYECWAFRDVHSLWGLRCQFRGPSEVRTLPRAFHTTEGAPHCWVGRWMERLLQENSPNCCRVSFFSLFIFKKFLLLILATPYKEGPVLSHSSPLQLNWGLSRSGPIMAQFMAGTHGLCGFTTFSLFPSL